MNWFTNLWFSIFPPSLPTVSLRRVVDNSSARDWKTSSIVWARCGLLVATYHNVTRRDAAIDLVDPATGKSRNLIRNSFETFGRPVLKDGWWYFPCEGHSPRIVRVRDSDGRVDAAGKTQPDDYSACGLGQWLAVCKRGGGRPYLWDFVTGKKGHAYRQVDGIVSGIAEYDGGTVVSVSDGAKSGVESSKGWFVPGACPTIAEASGRLVAMFKDGVVRDVSKGRLGSILGQTGRKACRSVTSGGLAFWTTSNPDSLWATNGHACRNLHDFQGPDASDGTKSGSLFDSDVAVDGKRIAVARSQANGGFEVWVGEIR